MQPILFIDPGPTQSGWIILQTSPKLLVVTGGVSPNIEVRKLVRKSNEVDTVIGYELPMCYGSVLSAAIVDTCRMCGAIDQITDYTATPITRPEIVQYHTGIRSAKKGQVWQCLVEKYGGKGTKSDPGFFYGISSHARDAAAGAIFIYEKIKETM